MRKTRYDTAISPSSCTSVRARSLARRLGGKLALMIDWSQCLAVERQPRKVSGAWVFKGTRVPVRGLFENLQGGAPEHCFVTALKHIAKANILGMREILKICPEAIFVQSESRVGVKSSSRGQNKVFPPTMTPPTHIADLPGGWPSEKTLF